MNYETPKREAIRLDPATGKPMPIEKVKQKLTTTPRPKGWTDSIEDAARWVLMLNVGKTHGACVS